MSSPESPPGRVDRLDASIRAAVEQVAAADPNPIDPFRGLYISDDLAVSLAQRSGDGLDARFDAAAAALVLTDVEVEVLALCAAPELSPRYGRLFAYLHDDVTKKLASPRLVARLLAQAGLQEATVLRAFEATAPLRRLGGIRLLDGGVPTPIAERQVKLSDRLVSFLVDTNLADRRRRRADLGSFRYPSTNRADPRRWPSYAACSPRRASCPCWLRARTRQPSSPSLSGNRSCSPTLPTPRTQRPCRRRRSPPRSAARACASTASRLSTPVSAAASSGP